MESLHVEEAVNSEPAEKRPGASEHALALDPQPSFAKFPPWLHPPSRTLLRVCERLAHIHAGVQRVPQLAEKACTRVSVSARVRRLCAREEIAKEERGGGMVPQN